MLINFLNSSFSIILWNTNLKTFFLFLFLIFLVVDFSVCVCVGPFPFSSNFIGLSLSLGPKFRTRSYFCNMELLLHIYQYCIYHLRVRGWPGLCVGYITAPYPAHKSRLKEGITIFISSNSSCHNRTWLCSKAEMGMLLVLYICRS